MNTILLGAVIAGCAGCSQGPVPASDRVELGEQRIFDLKEIPPKQGQAVLSELGFDEVSVVPGRNALAVRGSPGDLYRAGVVMDLVDTGDEFLIETLAPASDAKAVPANGRIAKALGDIALGTFANPPQQGERTRAIIDVHGRSVVAIIPARIQKELLAFIEFGSRPIVEPPEVAESPAPGEEAVPDEQVSPLPTAADGNDSTNASGLRMASVAPDTTDEAETPETKPPSGTAEPLETAPTVRPVVEANAPAEPNAQAVEKRPGAVKGAAWQSPAKPAATKRLYELAPPANGDDVLQLDLPDQVEISQLLDLAAEYLRIDYMYEPESIRGQSVSLRLHGKLQGDIRVKDLYPLLESVLKFKGFAMTRHKDNLVTIVPVAEALQADPMLMDPNSASLEAGNMVVTRVFTLRHISPTSAMNLLDGMKISAAASVVEETRSLIVTCYAHRMERIERLLEMVDRPGRPKELRFHELRHTTADSLVEKVKMIVAEMQTAGVEIASAEQRPAMNALAVRAASPSPDSGPSVDTFSPDLMESQTVYLDADERTNRILMVGYPEQLAVVEEVIGTLDVVQQDLRIFAVYEIQHVDAEEVRRHLAQFDLIDDRDVRTETPAGIIAKSVDSTPAPPVTEMRAAEKDTISAGQKPQTSVLTSSNSLLINATRVQHAKIAGVIKYVDTTARQEAIPYEIYFLENQDPEHLAEILRRLLQETVVDEEAKIEKVVPKKKDEEIVIVPDKNTFSLIVYASRKNQEWVRKLIKTLDKRRPQVLIDATLVEIRRNDEFNYDLEMVAGLPDLTPTSGQIPQFKDSDGTTVTDKLQSSGRSRFAEFHVKSGKGVGFYADEHIQALLTAVQSKNYGRVLAKPKVLVNDNEKGNIKTADTTYVVTKSSVPVAGGTAGQDDRLIETSLGYEPYEAGITLEITPHISDGDLLRLEVNLTRSDFTSTAGEKPPNQTSSNVGTVVTVPDGSTIILGGMLKLNQNKGGSKVPILGDLPLIGGLFRSVNTNDVQSMLYIFVRAEVIRPAETGSNSYEDLRRISDTNREAFERHEQEFQGYQTWPGVKPKTTSPPKVLEAR